MKIDEHRCPIIAETIGPKGHFFGFHDITPWNSDDTKLAILSISNDVRDVPNGEQAADICIWDPAANKYESVDQTTAWNFQQGARLQWLPKAQQKLVYNIKCGHDAHARILDTNSGKTKDYRIAISSISPSGKHALAPQFSRLGKHWRAYGYQGLSGLSVGDRAPSDDGLWEVDLEKNETRLLISISELDEIAGHPAPKESFRFLTHPSYSPSGTKIVFLERYFVPGGTLYTRMYCGDLAKRTWSLVAEEMVSHFDWFDDNTILVWARHISKNIKRSREDGLLALKCVRMMYPLARRFLQPFRKSFLKEYYAFVSLEASEKNRPFAADVLKSDGHPMFRFDRKWLITDSYPDSRGDQYVYLINMASNVIHQVGTFSADLELPSDIKCDLHPRWNRKGTHVAIDTSHRGERQMKILDLSEIIDKD